MTCRTVAAATLISAFLTAPAAADSYSSPPINGGAGSLNGTIACKIFNPEGVARTFAAISILRYTATQTSVATVLPTVDTCNPSLAAGKACTVSAPITNGNFSYVCKLNMVDSVTNLRAVVEITTPNPKSVLATGEITPIR